jgi:hypothetical protein
LLSNYNIKYICTTVTIYTRLCLMSIPKFALRDKVTLRSLKLLFKGVDVVEWSRALDVRLSEWCLQCINGVSSNPVEGRTKIWQLKNLITTLFGLIFRRIYIYLVITYLKHHTYNITNLVCYTYFHWFFSSECQHIFGTQTGYIFQSPKMIKTWTTKHYASLNQWYNTE